MPATTAIGSIGKGDARLLALKAGANVIMPNFTPHPYRALYDIYPGKRCIKENDGQCIKEVETLVKLAGRLISYSKGDLLKTDAPFSVIKN